ncbi:MAG: inositol phosphorylceramide synthase [Bacteroidetes bacterium]|nr:inositol phosphorylceramide synthase [Bacteroidota bacterium]
MRNDGAPKPLAAALVLRDQRAWARVRVPLIASAAYLALSYALIGFRPEQLVLAGLFSVLYLLSPATRRWVLGFSIFIVFWVLFDSMKAFPNYAVSTVHVGDLHAHELALFGVEDGGTLRTPNEYLALHTSSVADLLAGFFYLCWIPVPLGFAAYLFARDKALFLRFALSFLLVNLLGFIVYYVYPAAPPWYVALHGTGLIESTPGNTAGLARFDAITGTGIFRSIYGKSSNVFAAMPSLHAAYLAVVLYWGVKGRLGWINAVFATIMAGIWASAVYTGHHYVLDVLMGIACAVAGLLLFERLLRWPPFARLIDRYRQAITAPA